MPAWAKDEGTWKKAKSAVDKDWGSYDEPWAVVAHVYKQMGGTIGNGEALPKFATDRDLSTTRALSADEAKACDAKYAEAISAGSQGALQRPAQGAREAWTFEAVTGGNVRVNRAKREVYCRLITEGPGNVVNRNYYTEAFIRDAAIKYEGARAYLNHDTAAQRREQSEGDIRRLCGYYHSLEVKQDMDPKAGKLVWGVWGTLCCDDTAVGREAMAKAEAQIEYAKLFPNKPQEYCGLSINGTGLPGGNIEVDGKTWHQIVGVGEADSVDVVTRPARGGAFVALVESAQGAPTLNKEEDIMTRKALAILAKITEANAKLGAETDATKRAAIEADITELNVALKDAVKTGEAKPADDEDDMEEAKKMLPKGDDETDEAYKTRLTKTKAAFMKGKEAAITVDELRKNNPRLYEAIAGRVRAAINEKTEDVAELKAQLGKMTEAEREARIKLTVLEDTQEATKLLEAAQLPKKLIDVQDLIGKTTEEKKREIEKIKALVEEASGGRRPFNPGSGARSGGAQGGLKSSIESLRKRAGVDGDGEE